MPFACLDFAAAASSSLGGSGCEATGVSAGSPHTMVHTFLMILRQSAYIMACVFRASNLQRQLQKQVANAAQDALTRLVLARIV